MAGGVVRTGLDRTCTAVAMRDNRAPQDKKSDQGWVRLNERTVGWLASDHKLVGNCIVKGACDSFRCSKALDLETAEPGSLTKCLKCLLGIAAGLDATSERKYWFGARAALRPFLTC